MWLLGKSSRKMVLKIRSHTLISLPISKSVLSMKMILLQSDYAQFVHPQYMLHMLHAHMQETCESMALLLMQIICYRYN